MKEDDEFPLIHMHSETHDPYMEAVEYVQSGGKDWSTPLVSTMNGLIDIINTATDFFDKDKEAAALFVAWLQKRKAVST